LTYIVLYNNLFYTQFAAHQLHQDAKNWEEKDNDMVAAAKRMARLMMQMAKFAR